MDSEQKHKLELLSRCTFQVASWPKRFVHTLSSGDYGFADKELTVKQAYWLNRLYYMYREQIGGRSAGDIPAFIDPPLLNADVQLVGDDRADIHDWSIDPLKSKREREARAKLEAWNKSVVKE